MLGRGVNSDFFDEEALYSAEMMQHRTINRLGLGGRAHLLTYRAFQGESGERAAEGIWADELTNQSLGLAASVAATPFAGSLVGVVGEVMALLGRAAASGAARGVFWGTGRLAVAAEGVPILDAATQSAFRGVFRMTGGRGLSSMGASGGLRAAVTSGATNVRRFFYDARPFEQVRRGYWAANGPADGRSLHHWLFPQRAAWVPEGIRNAGMNLLDMPALRGLAHPKLPLNTYMGWARHWAGRPADAAAAMAWETGIRVGIPAAAVGSGAAGYSTGQAVGEWWWYGD